MIAYLWLLLSALLFSFGEYYSKRWGYEPSIKLTAVVLIFYASCSAAWLPALLYKNQLVIMGMIWALLSTVATVFVGAVVFGETVAWTAWVGIALAVVSMILLSL